MGKRSGDDGFTDKTTTFRVKVLVFRVYWTVNIEIGAKCLVPLLLASLVKIIIKLHLQGKFDF